LYKIGKWTVALKESKISSETTEIKLTAQSLAILTCLINGRDEIISKEQLIQECWNGRFASDDAIRRAIRELRSCLGCEGNNPSYIETIRKQGYRLIPEVTLVDDEVSDESNNSKKYFFGIVSALISLAIFSLFFIFADKKSSNFTIEDKYKIVTFDQEIEEYYTLSSLNWSAYSLRKNPNKANKNKIVVRNELGEIVLEFGTASNSTMANVLLPSFSPDGSKLAYLDYSPEACAINIISLSKSKGEKLSEIKCSGTDGHVVIEWHDNNSLYYSTSTGMEFPLAIKKIDLNSGELTQITNPQLGGRGDHAAKLCSNGNLLILRSVDWSNSQLVIYDTNSKNEVLHHGISGVVMSAEWVDDCEQIIIAEKDKPLSFFNIKNKETTYLNHFENIKFIHEHDGYLYLAEGETFITQISTINLKTKQEQELVKSNRSDYLYSKKPYSDDFAFVSERTGTPQVWISSSGGVRQLTDFTAQKSIKSLTWDTVGKQLFFIRGNSVHQVDPETKYVSLFLKPKGNIGSLIQLTENKWLFSSYVNGNWQAYEYDAVNISINLFNNMRIVKFTKNYKNETYFSTLNSDIYRFENESFQPEKISSTLPTEVTSWYAVDNKVYLYETAGGIERNIYEVNNLNNEKKIIFENINVSNLQFINSNTAVISKTIQGKVDVKKYKYH
jgi:DNA-binding winged helix-turn-helix (wHTH) protein